MRTVLNYNDFINEMNTFIENKDINDVNENLIITKYFNGEIKESRIEHEIYNDFKNYLAENDIILEKINIKELFQKGKKAVINWFFDIITNIVIKGKKALNKVASLISSVFKVIMRFTKKHPKLTKIMVIFIVIVVLLIISSNSAMAASGNPPSDVQLEQMSQLLDASIGYIGEMMDKNQTGPTQAGELTNGLLQLKRSMLGESADMSKVSAQAKETMSAAFDYILTFEDSEIQEYAEKGADFIEKFGVKEESKSLLSKLTSLKNK